MKPIKEYDDIICMTPEERAKVKVDSADLYAAYKDSMSRGLSVIDLNRMVLPESAEEIVAAMRRHGVRQFTISTAQDGLQNLLAELYDKGCDFYGMALVPSGEWTVVGNKREQIMLDAIEMTL